MERHSQGSTAPPSASIHPVPSHLASGQAPAGASSRRSGTTSPPRAARPGGRLRAGSELIAGVHGVVVVLGLEAAARRLRRFALAIALGHVAEAWVGSLESQVDVPDGAIAVLGQDQLRLALEVFVQIPVLALVVLLAKEEADEV